MTIQRAREILGQTASKMSDEDIQTIIDSFDSVIEVGFQQFEAQHIKSS